MAKKMSVVSMKSSTMNSGVARRLPFSIVNSFWPSRLCVAGKRLRAHLRTGLSSGCTCSADPLAILYAV
jgi:hypothetical protein